MTSFAPLAERVLSTLRNAAPGSYAARTAAEIRDLDAARRLSTEQRLDRLDDILRFSEEQCSAPGRTPVTPKGALRI